MLLSTRDTVISLIIYKIIHNTKNNSHLVIKVLPWKVYVMQNYPIRTRVVNDVIRLRILLADLACVV